MSDDRIRCTDCQYAGAPRAVSLRCSILRHDVMIDLPRRCGDFQPLRGAADQRTGAERFPSAPRTETKARKRA